LVLASAGLKIGSKIVFLPVVLVIFLLLPLTIASGAGSPLVFQTTWGAADRNAAYGLGADASGNVYVAGTTNLNLPPDYVGAQGTIFLLKYDPHGTLVWQRSWTGSSTAGGELGGRVAVDAQGDSFVAATTTVTRQNACEGTYSLPGILLLKFDTAGNLVWQKTFAGSCRLAPYGIAVSQTGNIFLTALSWEQIDNSQNRSGSPFLIKLDSEGNVLWARTIDWNCICAPAGVAVDGSENVVMNGDLIAKFDSAGSLIWEENLFIGLPTKAGATYLSGTAVAFDNSGNIYTTGNGELVKLASSGNVVWAKQWGNNSYGAGLEVDSSNNILLSGEIRPHTGGIPNWPNPFLIKLDPKGALLGQTVWEGTSASNDYGSGILTVDSHQHAYMSGAVSGKPPFNSHYDVPTVYNVTAYAGACNNTGCGLFPDLPPSSLCACYLWSYPVAPGNITSGSPNGTSNTLQGESNSGGQNDIFLLGYDATQLSLAPNYFVPELVIGAASVGAAIVATTFFVLRRRRRRTQQSGIQPVEALKSALPT
jgi:hypothetical protein